MGRISYMENIMAECNTYTHTHTHTHARARARAHIGWLYNKYGGKYRGDDRTIVNSDTRSGHCLAEPRVFYSSDVYDLPLASAK